MVYLQGFAVCRNSSSYSVWLHLCGAKLDPSAGEQQSLFPSFNPSRSPGGGEKNNLLDLVSTFQYLLQNINSVIRVINTF